MTTTEKPRIIAATEDPNDAPQEPQDGDKGEEEGKDVAPEVKMPAAAAEAPDWVLIPSDFRPQLGMRLFFVKFTQELTGSLAGEHQCVLSALSDKEEALAAERTQGHSGRAAAEYTKQMLRVVDGYRVNWAAPRGPGSVDEFWRNIGPKGRNLLIRIYTKLHMASDPEMADFFENCVAVYVVS